MPLNLSKKGFLILKDLFKDDISVFLEESGPNPSLFLSFWPFLVKVNLKKSTFLAWPDAVSSPASLASLPTKLARPTAHT
jgi:hypothetical protein